jgi:hypothetical protein
MHLAEKSRALNRVGGGLLVACTARTAPHLLQIVLCDKLPKVVLSKSSGSSLLFTCDTCAAGEVRLSRVQNSTSHNSASVLRKCRSIQNLRVFRTEADFAFYCSCRESKSMRMACINPYLPLMI